MTGLILAAFFVLLFILAFGAWRRYLWAVKQAPEGQTDTCPYSLTEVFGDRHLVNVPHQEGAQWLTEIFGRSAKKFPHHTALQIPHSGESLSFAELDAQAEIVASALAPLLTGPDQIVAVAMAQDNWQIVASQLGILKAGGTMMFLDTTLPYALITHMLADAQTVAVLTRGQGSFRGHHIFFDPAHHIGIVIIGISHPQDIQAQFTEDGLVDFCLLRVRIQPVFIVGQGSPETYDGLAGLLRLDHHLSRMLCKKGQQGHE